MVAQTVRTLPDTLQVYGQQWLQTAALNLKVRSLRFYTDNLKNHIFPELGSHAVANIARKDCRTLVTKCREKGFDPTHRLHLVPVLGFQNCGRRS